MEPLLRELRNAARRLLRSSGYTTVAVLLLGLGIGVNAAIYSLIEASLLRPLPVREPDRLVLFSTGSSFPDFVDLRERFTSLSGMAASGMMPFVVTSGEQSESLDGALVSEGYFDLLGVRPAVGRPFLPGEAEDPAASVAVIGHELWQRAFSGDPEIVGRNVEINGQPFTVVGIAPPGFKGLSLRTPVHLWLPIAAQPRLATGFMAGINLLQDRGSRWHEVVGRLAPGRAPGQGQAELELLEQQLAREHPDSHRGQPPAELVPIYVAATGVEARGDFVRFLGLLAVLVAAILLITCANLGNLLLLRALGRSRDVAVQVALGARRGELVRHVLAESIFIGILGGTVGIALAHGVMRLLASFGLPGSVAIGELAMELRPTVLLFALLLALATGLLFGAMPALHAARLEPLRELRQRSGAGGRGTLRIRAGLVSLQVALCLVLLIGAGLFVRSLRNALAVDLGIEVDRVVVLPLDLGLQRYDAVRAEGFTSALLEGLRSRPGVQSAGLVQNLPLSSTRWRVFPEGLPPGPNGEKTAVYLNSVSADYFKTLGIPLQRGRGFSASDRPGAPPVAVANESLARLLWPDREPLGQHIEPMRSQDLEIVGVVRDSVYASPLGEPVPMLYLPVTQSLGSSRLLAPIHLVVRAERDPGEVLPLLRREVRALDREVPLTRIEPLSQRLAAALMPQRFGVRLLGLFGVLGLVLVCLGVYGVVADSVQRRRREIGIRMALGAQPGDVLRLVVVQSVVPVVLGLIVGLSAAFGLTRFLTAFLYGVGATDPATFAGMTALLLAAALAASWFPVRSAVRVDPVAELRQE